MAVTVLLPPEVDDGTCPVRSILDRVGNRWTTLVISRQTNSTRTARNMLSGGIWKS